MKAILAVLLLVPLAAALPDDSPGFGGLLEPEPPELAPPNLPVDALGTVTTILVQGSGAGDVIAAPVGQGIVTVTETANNLSVEMVTGGTLTQFSVERLTGDYSIILTSWSTAISQGGVEDFQPYELGESSFAEWTAVHDFQGLQLGNVLAPETVTTTVSEQSYLLDSIPLIHGLIADFDSVIETDVEAGLQSAIDGAAASADATAIESDLASVAQTGLDLNALLDALEDDPTKLAALNVADLADKLDQLGYQTKVVSYPGDPRTVMQDGVLSFVNGGAGPVLFMPGSTLNVDNGKATAIRDATSKLSLWSLTQEDQTPLIVGKDVGSYNELHQRLGRFQAIGVPIQVEKDLAECQAKALCTKSNNLVEPDINSLLALGGLGKLTSIDPTGLRGGGLKEMPELDIALDRFIAADRLEWPRAGKLALPDGGVGSVKDINLPTGIERPALPQTGDFTPTLPMALLEHWSAPGLPGVQPIVPVIGDLAAMAQTTLGQLVTMVPANGAIPGLEKTLTLRFVDSFTSLRGPLGISGVTSTVITEDPLGIQSITVTKSSDAQGYAGPYPMPYVGSWVVRADHPEYFAVEGAGSSSPNQPSEGQEFQMESSDDSLVGKVKKNSLILTAIAALAVIGYFVWRKFR